MQFQIKKTVSIIKKPDGQYLLKTQNDRYWVVSKDVTKIIVLLQQNKLSIEELADKLVHDNLSHKGTSFVRADESFNSALTLTTAELNQLLTQQLANKGLFTHEADIETQSIMWVRVPIIKGVGIRAITFFGQHLFHRVVILPSIFLSLLIIGYFMSTEVFGHYAPKDLSRLISQYQGNELFLIYCLMTVSMLIHEMGHASALAHYNKRCKNIGFGLYWVLFVFYADVTEAWELKPEERLSVDLGGIFFQMILLTLMILIYYFSILTDYSSIILLVVFGNVIAMVVNLLPILKLDGYWIVADFLNITNLAEKSLNSCKQILFNKVLNKKLNFEPRIDFDCLSTFKKYFLGIYLSFATVALIFFMGYGLTMGLHYLINFPYLFTESINTLQQLSTDQWLSPLFAIFVKGLICLSFLVLFIRLFVISIKGLKFL
ncbi:MAG: hypothetical protein HON94_16280 [Methylococcales bacterium]|jgi:putative peptide zinc metalloprotease protein|nr:hypothetical protein [Methylococcales bacterium]MBT7410876.1 hypothetical protein [Methylococcales bacterium]